MLWGIEIERRASMFHSNSNLVVYTFLDMKLVFVERNEEFIEAVAQSLTSLYEQHLKPAISIKYLYKDYDCIISKIP